MLTQTATVSAHTLLPRHRDTCSKLHDIVKRRIYGLPNSLLDMDSSLDRLSRGAVPQEATPRMLPCRMLFLRS